MPWPSITENVTKATKAFFEEIKAFIQTGATGSLVTSAAVDAPVILQEANGDDANPITLGTSGTPMQAGNTLLLLSQTEQGTGNITAVKGGGVTWTKVASVITTGGLVGLALDMWVGYNSQPTEPNGEPIEITMSGGTEEAEKKVIWVVQEWAGPYALDSVVTVPATALSSGELEPKLGELTPANFNETLYVGLVGINAGGAWSSTVQAGWTTVENIGSYSSNHAKAVYKTANSLTKEPLTIKRTASGAQTWTGIYAAFRLRKGVAGLTDEGVLDTRVIPPSLAHVPGNWEPLPFREGTVEESGVAIPTWKSISSKILKLTKHGLTNGTPVQISGLSGGAGPSPPTEGLSEGQKSSPIHAPFYMVTNAKTNEIELLLYGTETPVSWPTSEVTAVTLTPLLVAWRAEAGAGGIGLRGQLKCKAGKSLTAGTTLFTATPAAHPLYTQTFTVYVGTEPKKAVPVTATINTLGECTLAVTVAEGETVYLDGTGYRLT